MSEIIVCKYCDGRGKTIIHRRLQHGKESNMEECPYCNGDGRKKKFTFLTPIDTKAVRFIAVNEKGEELNLGQSG